jgi:hypothetical protein
MRPAGGCVDEVIRFARLAAHVIAARLDLRVRGHDEERDGEQTEAEMGNSVNHGMHRSILSSQA